MENKFRAWDKTENKFVPNTNICLLQDGEVLHFESPTDYNFKSKKWFDIQFYIGLHDKNDIEICDGDILEIIEINSDGEKEPSRTELVEWNEMNGSWDIGTFPNIGNRFIDEWGEIIGNIKENPELLTKKQ